jgi:hypothetical protein
MLLLPPLLPLLPMLSSCTSVLLSGTDQLAG